MNRQSLDRVVPGVRIAQWEQQFSAAGWHVVEAKYGRALQAAFGQPGGDSLRDWIDAMPNEHYQSLFGLEPAAVRERVPGWRSPGRPGVLRRHPRRRARPLVTDLAGHDLGSLLDRLRRVRRGKGPAERAVRLHHQGLGPAHRRQSAQSLGAAHHRPDRPDAATARAHAGDRMGPARPDDPGRAVGCGPARAPGQGAPSAYRERGRRPRCHRPARGQADLHAGGVRPHPGGPVQGRIGCAVPGDDRARRRDVDQPGRLHQPDRRVQPGAAARLERGPGRSSGPRVPTASTSSSASAR